MARDRRGFPEGRSIKYCVPGTSHEFLFGKNRYNSESRPPAGSKTIDKTPWSGDHQAIKDDLGVPNDGIVVISPDGDVWAQDPDGSWNNEGAAEDYTESGRPSGRRGKDRGKRR